MGGKGLICTTRVQASTTHDSGLAGLGFGGVTGNPETNLRESA